MSIRKMWSSKIEVQVRNKIGTKPMYSAVRGDIAHHAVLVHAKALDMLLFGCLPAMW